jgi:hypothetical protein
MCTTAEDANYEVRMFYYSGKLAEARRVRDETET